MCSVDYEVWESKTNYSKKSSFPQMCQSNIKDQRILILIV